MHADFVLWFLDLHQHIFAAMTEVIFFRSKIAHFKTGQIKLTFFVSLALLSPFSYDNGTKVTETSFIPSLLHVYMTNESQTTHSFGCCLTQRNMKTREKKSKYVYYKFKVRTCTREYARTHAHRHTMTFSGIITICAFFSLVSKFDR